MSGKRDKKRYQRRRADQQRHAATRRERQRRADDVIRSFVTVLDELEALAAEDECMPEQFVQRLVVATSGDEVVAGLLRDPEDSWRRAEQIAAELRPERAVALAEALCADSTDTSAARWWAVGLLCGAGEKRRAEEVATATLQTLGPHGAAFGGTHLVAHLRLELGRPVDALICACALVEADSSDAEAQHLQALALRDIDARDQDDHELPSHACPCGAGRETWVNCCKPREREAVAWFANRERLYALRLAVGAFITRDTVLESHLDESREEWAAAFEDPDALPDLVLESAGPHENARELLALERAWVLAPNPNEDAPMSLADGADDEDAGSVLRLYADDVSTPPDLALLARTWQKSAICGLWQVADLDGGANLWLMDIVTGETRWVSMAPEQLQGAARWSVLAGWLVPDRGVWRSGGAFALLSPDEGDIAAEVAHTMTEDVAHAVLRQRRGRNLGRGESGRQLKLDPPPAHGILSAWTDEVDPVVSHLHHTVLGISLPEVIAIAIERRRRPPRLHNTDGEPLELLRGIGHIDNPAALRAALERRPDFDGPDDEGRITWRGREMTALEAETSFAELRALATERGLPVDEEDHTEPRHWVRGLVDIDGFDVSVEVNSSARLEAVSEILTRLGVGQLVVDQRFDPALGLDVPGGWRPLWSAGSPEAEEAWCRRWLDEALPALFGKTPRQAVTEPETAIELERLLRSLEFDADLAAQQGRRPLDVEQIRRAVAEEGQLFQL